MAHKFTVDDHRAGANAVNNSLTPAQRTAKARKAAETRWKGKKLKPAKANSAK